MKQQETTPEVNTTGQDIVTHTNVHACTYIIYTTTHTHTHTHTHTKALLHITSFLGLHACTHTNAQTHKYIYTHTNTENR